MAYIFIGFILFFLVLLSERLLILVSPFEIEQWRTEKSRQSRQLLQITEQIKPTLGALFLARVFITIVVTVFAAHKFLHFLSSQESSNIFPQIDTKGKPFLFAATIVFVFLMAFLFKGILLLVNNRFWSTRYNRLLYTCSFFILFWKKIFAPLTEKKQEEAIKKYAQNNEIPSKNDDSTGKNAKNHEMEMLKSIVKFSDVTVKQVMQARSKVVAVDFRISYSELLDTVRESGFSRMPVYDDDLDNVVGLLYVKDLVPHLKAPDSYEWQSLVRPNVMMVPELKRISELLRDFKKQKMHMAIVVDEYGGCSGLVSMEDVLEEITGDIQDEFDEETEILFQKLDDRNYLFEARILLTEMCPITGISMEKIEKIRENADTLAGLALEINGDIPKKGAEIWLDDILLTIYKADNRRIEQIKLTLPQ